MRRLFTELRFTASLVILVAWCAGVLPAFSVSHPPPPVDGARCREARDDLTRRGTHILSRYRRLPAISALQPEVEGAVTWEMEAAARVAGRRIMLHLDARDCRPRFADTDPMIARVLAHELGHLLMRHDEVVWEDRRLADLERDAEVAAEGVGLDLFLGAGFDCREWLAPLLPGVADIIYRNATAERYRCGQTAVIEPPTWWTPRGPAMRVTR